MLILFVSGSDCDIVIGMYYDIGGGVFFNYNKFLFLLLCCLCLVRSLVRSFSVIVFKKVQVTSAPHKNTTHFTLNFTSSVFLVGKANGVSQDSSLLIKIREIV